MFAPGELCKPCTKIVKLYSLSRLSCRGPQGSHKKNLTECRVIIGGNQQRLASQSHESLRVLSTRDSEKTKYGADVEKFAREQRRERGGRACTHFSKKLVPAPAPGITSYWSILTGNFNTSRYVGRSCQSEEPN